MQLYFLSPIILYPIWLLRKRVKLAISLIFGVASISVIFVFVTYMIKEFRVSFLYEKNGIKDAMVYTVSHGRLDSWMMGILVGFIMHLIRGKVVKIPRAIVVVGWVASIFTIFVVIICHYQLQQENFKENPLIFDAAYDSLKRICWCLAIAWIILACHLSYGGIVKRFLSLSIWLPISKLSFCIYLVHLPVQIMYLASLRSPIFFSDYRAIHKFSADFSVSFFVAFAWSLMFEFPSLRVISIFISKKGE